MLGLLGLRVCQACNVRIQDTHGLERGHRTLTLVGKGRKPATIPLPPPVAEVMDAAAGQRDSGAAAATGGRQADGPPRGDPGRGPTGQEGWYHEAHQPPLAQTRRHRVP